MNKKFLAAALAATIASGDAGASTFRVLGSRALGMGTAGVATADGADAAYWNPAALAAPTHNGWQLPVGAEFEATGDILKKAADIAVAADNVKTIREKTKNGGRLELADVSGFTDAAEAILALRKTGQGAIVGAHGGFQVRNNRWAFSLNNLTEAGATGIVDTRFDLGTIGSATGVTVDGDPTLNNSGNTGLRDSLTGVIDKLVTNANLPLASGQTPESAANRLLNDAEAKGTSPEVIAALVQRANSEGSILNELTTGGGSFGENQTNVTLRSASISELAASYGYPLGSSEKWGDLAVGGSLKALRGQIAFSRVFLLQGEDTSLKNILTDARRNDEVSYRPGVDLGLMYKFPWYHKVQLGVLGRNVNSPKFKSPSARLDAGENDYREDAQYRAGFAYWPFPRWSLATDIDLKENRTNIPGFPSQVWGLGTEVVLGGIALRGGLYRNFAAGTETAFTTGAQVRLGDFSMDLAAALAQEHVELKTSEGTVPSVAQVGVTFGWVF